MKEYMLSLIGVSVLLGVLFMVAPSKHKKHLRLLGGLCLLAVFTSSFSSFLNRDDLLLFGSQEPIGEDAKIVYEEIYHQTLSDANVERLELALESMMARDISMKREEFSVSIHWEWSQDRILLKNATVYLSGSAVLCDPKTMIGYVEERLNCPCEIVYGIDEKSQ